MQDGEKERAVIQYQLLFKHIKQIQLEKYYKVGKLFGLFASNLIIGDLKKRINSTNNLTFLRRVPLGYTVLCAKYVGHDF
jgi:hypothetical protein